MAAKTKTVEIDNSSIDEAGFEQLSPEQSTGFVVKKEDAVVMGDLLLRTERKDGKGVYQIRLHRPCMTTREKIESVSPSGSVVDLGEHSALHVLRKHVDNGSKCVVIVRYGAKRDLDGGQSYWPASVKVKVIQAATRASGIVAGAPVANPAQTEMDV